jgi:hypothetical protein
MSNSREAGRANRPNEQAEVLRAEFESFKSLMEERNHRYDAQFKFTDEKTSLALSASDKAVTKSEIATEKRFDSVNEFRAQLKDQAATLMPREEATNRFKSIEDKIEDVKTEGKRDKQYDFRTLLTVISMLVAIAALFLRFQSH